MASPVEHINAEKLDLAIFWGGHARVIKLDMHNEYLFRDGVRWRADKGVLCYLYEHDFGIEGHKSTGVAGPTDEDIESLFTFMKLNRIDFHPSWRDEFLDCYLKAFPLGNRAKDAEELLLMSMDAIDMKVVDTRNWPVGFYDGSGDLYVFKSVHDDEVKALAHADKSTRRKAKSSGIPMEQQDQCTGKPKIEEFSAVKDFAHYNVRPNLNISSVNYTKAEKQRFHKALRMTVSVAKQYIDFKGFSNA